MSDSIFKIGSSKVDAAQIVADIQAAVEKKIHDGEYTDAAVARAERANLDRLKNEEEFYAFYIECLRESVFVDIGDFDIIERRAKFSRLLVALKSAIWKLLRFYTYRLWSQQNQVNGLLLSAVEGLDARYTDRIEKMEKRISELEPGESSS
jgi:hypothetical protein